MLIYNWLFKFFNRMQKRNTVKKAKNIHIQNVYLERHII